VTTVTASASERSSAVPIIIETVLPIWVSAGPMAMTSATILSSCDGACCRRIMIVTLITDISTRSSIREYAW
jgi:hypothetical protein